MLKTRILQALIGLMMMPLSLMAQVTSGTISGTVRDLKGAGLQGATVEAVHEPSGTKYKTSSTKTGNFSLPGLRVGGPYKVTVTYVGFKTEVANDLTVQLGDPTVLEFAMADEKAQLTEVTVSTIANKRGALISKDRKGAGTNINKRIINSMPTLSRSITDITKLTPQGGGTSFAGQDNRAINFTLDGSIFNNSFGLQPLNGSQTNS
ncbi:MAG: carboxypeptidase-like regulatory domain-containing protein, partial [Chitinophagaceae bacterium]